MAVNLFGRNCPSRLLSDGRMRRIPAHVIFSRVAQDLSHRVNRNKKVILHIQHRMSHAPSLLFPLHLSTTSLSICTPVRPSTRPSTRPSLISTSHGDFSFAKPSNVSIRPLAETQSPTVYEPKDLTEEDNSFLVKPMLFHRPSMTSLCYSAESIATPIRPGICWLHRCAYRRRRSTCRPTTRKISDKFISLPRRYRETCRSVLTQESRVKKHSPTEKAFPKDINQFEEKMKLHSDSLIRKKVRD